MILACCILYYTGDIHHVYTSHLHTRAFAESDVACSYQLTIQINKDFVEEVDLVEEFFHQRAQVDLSNKPLSVDTYQDDL